MKKIFLLCFLVSFLFSANIRQLSSINELEENKDVFLMFGTSYCHWCAKQEKSLEKVQEKRKNLSIFIVEDDTKIYKELLDKYPFVIEFYPTSYFIVKRDGKIEINYEFQGFQKEKNILEVFDDRDNF